MIALAVIGIVPTTLVRADAASNATPLRLIDQSAPTRFGSSAFSLKVEVGDLDSDSRLIVQAHEAVLTHADFGDMIAGGKLSAPLDSPIEFAARDLTVVRGAVTLRIPFQLDDDIPRKSTLRIPSAGVYPIEIRVDGARDRDGAPEPLVTWLSVAARSDEASPLRIAWIWSMPALRFDTEAEAAASVRTLERNAAVLSAFDQPVAVDVRAATLLKWQEYVDRHSDQRPAFNRLLRELRSDNRVVIVGPYANVDAATLSRNALDDNYEQQLDAGITLLADNLGLEPDLATAYVREASAASIELVERAGIERIVLAEGTLRPIDSQLLHRRYSLADRTLMALSPSAFAEQRLRDAGASPTQRAQQFAAYSALTAATQPNAVVVVDLATTSTDVLATAAAVDRALPFQNPITSPLSIDEAFTAAREGTDGNGRPLQRTIRAPDPSPLRVDLARARALETRIIGYTNLVGGRDPKAVAARLSYLDAFERTASASGASHSLDRAQALVESFNADVSITTRTLTLTERVSQVPLAFVNRTGRDLRLRVTLQSPKIDQREPDQVIELPAEPENKTARILVEVRGSGEFPVKVTLTSADGNLVVGTPTTIQMNSTVFGAYGSWLTYGALAFLTMWWLHHGWRSRQKRRAGEPQDPQPATDRDTVTS